MSNEKDASPAAQDQLKIICNHLSKLSSSLDELLDPLAGVIKGSGHEFPVLDDGVHATGFIGAAISILGLIAAYSKNEPIHFEKKLRLGYVLVVTALFIAAVAAPVAAMYLGIAAAGAGLVYGLFRMGQMVRMALAKSKIKKSIEDLKQEIDTMIHDFNGPNFEEKLSAIQRKEEDLERLSERYLQYRLNFPIVFPRVAGMLGAACALAAAITFVVFPPATLILSGVALAVSLIGLGYKLGKMIQQRLTQPKVPLETTNPKGEVTPKQLMDELNQTIEDELGRRGGFEKRPETQDHKPVQEPTLRSVNQEGEGEGEELTRRP